MTAPIREDLLEFDNAVVLEISQSRGGVVDVDSSGTVVTTARSSHAGLGIDGQERPKRLQVRQLTTSQ